MGDSGGAVEMDETYIGRLEGQPTRRAGFAHKNAVFTLVERGSSARSFRVDLLPIIEANVSREAKLIT